MSGKKSKLEVFSALHKISLWLEIPLIWSFFATKLPEISHREFTASFQQVHGCSIFDAAQGMFEFKRDWSLKALVVKNSVLHDFGFEKVSQIHETFLMELQLFGWRHFSKTEVVQNIVLNH